MIKTIVVIICLLLPLQMTGFCYAQKPSAESEKEYVIATGDVLEISVYGEPDLSATMRVSQDGSIAYPFLGDIKVSGFTVRELERQMESLLGEDYLVVPQVSIFVKEYARISLLGKVKTPGSYEIKENFTLTQAIAIAGGFTEGANSNSVKVIRTVDGKKETLEVNVDRIFSKTAPDFEIKANDIIMVDEYGKVTVLGQVKQPGQQQIKENLTISEVIALAGGFAETANPTNVKINRTVGGKKETLEINVDRILDKTAPDFEIKTNDIIMVEEFGRYSIMGQVMRPGVYNLKKGLTVVEAIGIAGGFTTTAAQNGVKVVRQLRGQRESIRVPVASIMSNGDKDKDIVLKEGDTIVVPGILLLVYLPLIQSDNG